MFQVGDSFVCDLTVRVFGVVVVTGEPSSRILTHLDRCDVRGCGARAFARGLFSELREEQKTAAVDLCGHHWHTAPASFREQAYHVIDETDRILED